MSTGRQGWDFTKAAIFSNGTGRLRKEARPIRVLLTDDHTITRQCVRALIETHPGMAVTAEASDGLESVKMTQEQYPDLVVMDIGMPHMNGIEATRRILKACKRTAVVILSMRDDEQSVVQSLKAGAQGYVLKDSPPALLIAAIRAALRGTLLVSPKIGALLKESRQPSDEIDARYERLTDREREVFQLLAEGRSNKELEALLYISGPTVQVHRRHIFEKLGFHCLAQVTLCAIRKGIIGQPSSRQYYLPRGSCERRDESAPANVGQPALLFGQIRGLKSTAR